MNRSLLAGFALLAALPLVGCGGGPKVVPVSGVVTLDGKPYPNAVVAFQPHAGPGNENPGMGSSAVTDENGRYTLYTMDGKTGAVVGKHLVRIQTKRDDPTAFFDPTTGSEDNPDADPKKSKGKIDPIPLDWYSDKGGKEFPVPEGGTDKADFAIESVKVPPKKK